MNSAFVTRCHSDAGIFATNDLHRFFRAHPSGRHEINRVTSRMLTSAGLRQALSHKFLLMPLRPKPTGRLKSYCSEFRNWIDVTARESYQTERPSDLLALVCAE